MAAMRFGRAEPDELARGCSRALDDKAPCNGDGRRSCAAAAAMLSTRRRRAAAMTDIGFDLSLEQRVWSQTGSCAAAAVTLKTQDEMAPVNGVELAVWAYVGAARAELDKLTRVFIQWLHSRRRGAAQRQWPSWASGSA